MFSMPILPSGEKPYVPGEGTARLIMHREAN
jgi:hypothetical protein